jgi:hypothetical protein
MSFTLATFRRAEFGLRGVIMPTFKQMPRKLGAPKKQQNFVKTSLYQITLRKYVER